ncbi:CHAT domain-containing protein [Streptomyces sp. BR123]|uniref:CHAT domain-containing protein n=1 Tax=Streptomyces sp. BR123 TaxID=2749828 RepID=UPI0015C451F2|nr:CHAT domain-containing protein [Streptomyces sp. BR123]NXY95809.1 CHAT domain-containing protein [Streptomyces sp. BR123]
MAKNPLSSPGEDESPDDIARLDELLSAEEAFPPEQRGVGLVAFADQLREANRSPATAVRALEAALPVLKNLLLRGLSYMLLAYFNKHNRSQARQLAEEALRCFKALEGDPHKKWAECMTYQLLGDLANLEGQQEVAGRLAEKALDLAQEIDNPQGQILAQSLAHRLIAQITIDAEVACRHAELALELAQEASSPRNQILAHDLLAEGYLSLGDLDKAQHHAECELEYARSLDSRNDEYDALLVLAKISLRRRHFQSVEEQVEKARDVTRHSRDSGREGNEFLVLGLASWYQGRLSESRERLNHALRSAEASGDSMLQGNVFLILGELERRHDDYGTALRHTERALDLFKEAHDPIGQGNAHQLIGELATAERLGVERASYHINQALNFAKITGNIAGQQSALVTLSQLALQGADGHALKAARDHAQAALAMAQRTGDLLGLGNAHQVLGEILYASGTSGQSREHLEEALEQASTAGNFLGMTRAHWALSKLLNSGGNKPEALEHALAAVRNRDVMRLQLGSAASRAAFLTSSEELNEWALTLAAELEDGIAALEVAEAGRGEALAELLHRSARGESETPPRVRALLSEIEELEFETAAHSDVADPSVLVPAPTSVGNWRLHEGEQEERRRSLYQELGELTGNAFRDIFTAEPMSAHTLRRRLPPDAHTLILCALPGWWKESNFPLFRIWIPPAPAEPVVEKGELTKERIGWLEDLTNARGGIYLQGSITLSDPEHRWSVDLAKELLPAELRRQLTSVKPEGEEPEKLIIVPSGELWAMPFAALRLGEHYLIDHAVLTLLPSLRMLPSAEQRQEERNRLRREERLRAVAYLHSDVTEHLKLDSLRTAYDLQVLNNPSSLRREFHVKDGYQLAVLVAHGDDQPGLRQSLRLQDSPVERLSAAQLLDCHLPPHLVLGACWSGAQSFAFGEEPIGLPAVALTRGAKFVTAALYPVGIETTAAILKDYLGELVMGLPPAEALRKVQRNYAAGEHGESKRMPWYWAGLVTITRAP